MATPEQRRMGRRNAKKVARKCILDALSEEARETIFSWREAGIDGAPVSFTECAKLAIERYAPAVTAHVFLDWYKAQLMVRRYARASGQFSSLDSILDGQLATMEAGLQRLSEARLAEILSEQRSSEESDRTLGKVGSILDSLRRNALAKKDHALKEKADRRAEQAMKLAQREQQRKEDSLKLDQEKFEETNRRMEKARKLIAEAPTDGGMPAALMTKIEDTLCGRA